MFEDGEQLPSPSRLEEIMRDPDCINAIAYSVVSEPDSKPHTVRVNVTITEMTLRQIDSNCAPCWRTKHIYYLDITRVGGFHMQGT